MTFPHTKPVQAQQSNLGKVTVQLLDMDLIITAEPTVEAEHPTGLQQTTAPPKHPEVILPHTQTVQAQQLMCLKSQFNLCTGSSP